MAEKTATMRPVDQAVIHAFIRKSALSGNLLETDGHSLHSLVPLGAEKLAVWRGSKIAVVASESSKFQASVLRALIKKAGKGVVVFDYLRPGHDLSITFQTGGDASYRGQWNGWILAYVPWEDRPVGKLEWSSWEFDGREKYLVNMVEVDPMYRRSGIATQMYKKLFRDQRITKKDLEPSTLTPEGAQFRSRAVLGMITRLADAYLNRV